MRLRPALLALAALALATPAAAIVGGRSAPADDAVRRHTVLLELPGARCSGVVIAPRLVLSAAHCFGRLGRYRVRLADKVSTMRVAEPEHVALHPDQNPLARKRRDNANDVALLLLKAPVTGAVRPVPIAPSWTPANGEKLLAAGFGLTSSSGEVVREVALRRVELEPLDPGYTGTPIQRLYSGDTSEDSADAGACGGDSGGPIFRKTATGLELVAVINWSIGKSPMLNCGDITGVTAIQSYLPWIEAQSREWGVAFQP